MELLWTNHFSSTSKIIAQTNYQSTKMGVRIYLSLVLLNFLSWRLFNSFSEVSLQWVGYGLKSWVVHEHNIKTKSNAKLITFFTICLCNKLWGIELWIYCFYPSAYNISHKRILTKILDLTFSKRKCCTKAIMDYFSEGPIRCDHVRWPLENKLNLRWHVTCSRSISHL